MLGIGGTELAIILIFGFLIFGPDRLPSMGRTIGRALRQFRQAQDQMNKMVKSEITDPLNAAMKEPTKKQAPKKKVTGKSSTSKPETFAEKKARLAAEAQAASQRKASGEEVVPAAADAVEVPVRKAGVSETFAQKKARLEAEKKAEEAKKASGSVATTKATTPAKKPGASAAKLYGIDKDRIAAARAAAAAKKEQGKEDQADA